MVRFTYRFLLVLVVFAVIGGPMGQLAHSPQLLPSMAMPDVSSTAMADVPCNMVMPMAGAGHGAPMAPCTGLTPDCIKQIGCVANMALPIRLADNDASFVFGPVAYWSARSSMAGVARTPEPLPPRTA